MTDDATITDWEARVIRYAATSEGDVPDTDKVWDTVMDLKKRGLMVEVVRGNVTHMVPTPEALVCALEARDND